MFRLLGYFRAERQYFPRVSGDIPMPNLRFGKRQTFSPRERGALFRWFQKRATRFSLSEPRKFYNKWLVITGRYAVIRLRRNVLRQGTKIEKQSSRIAAVHLLPKNHGNLVMSHLWETQSLGSKRTYSNALADQETQVRGCLYGFRFTPKTQMLVEGERRISTVSKNATQSVH